MHANSGSFCLKQFAQKLLTAAQAGDENKVVDIAKNLMGVGSFIWSAMEDTAECLAMSNADCVPYLRDTWLEQASFLTVFDSSLWSMGTFLQSKMLNILPPWWVMSCLGFMNKHRGGPRPVRHSTRNRHSLSHPSLGESQVV